MCYMLNILQILRMERRQSNSGSLSLTPSSMTLSTAWCCYLHVSCMAFSLYALKDEPIDTQIKKRKEKELVFFFFIFREIWMYRLLASSSSSSANTAQRGKWIRESKCFSKFSRGGFFAENKVGCLITASGRLRHEGSDSVEEVSNDTSIYIARAK